jgi:hypothetical protein
VTSEDAESDAEEGGGKEVDDFSISSDAAGDAAAVAARE